MSGLTIYKASAGSGKTFKLTGEYLQLLFQNPGLYRNILAVTFTNKATGEMKHRILYELDRLARGDASGYHSMLQDRFGMDHQQVQKRAADIRHRILHDYSRFSVSTIDRFFQRVLRTFAREIGLQSGYTLETDQTEILNFVIDDLLLATEEDQQLRQWLVDFAHSRMEEGKSWNFRHEIMNLAGELMKEEVKDLRLGVNEKLRDREQLAAYVKELKSEQARFENTLQQYGRQAVELMEKNALAPEAFKYAGKGVAQYFYYLKDKRRDKLSPNANVLKVLDDPEKWPSGKLDKANQDLVISLASDHLNGMPREAVDYQQQNMPRYLTIKEILKNIYVLGLLVDIQQRVNDHCREKNIFLIADAGDLLRRIIAGNEAPFVYEKTGSIYHHFMIDEFQDTSRFQWDNFRPLVHNSLAQSRYNLMVGDVKQSIYRWRNGDWKILQDEVYREFQSSARSVSLDYNWRSRSNVVAFNNTFFHYAPGILQHQYDRELEQLSIDNPYSDKLLEAYQDVRQKMPEERAGGMVFTRFFTHPHQKEADAREEARQAMIGDVEMLQDQGYRLSDMAIMVRTNREGQEIADALTQRQNQSGPDSPYRYEFISNDSLYVMRAESVKLLVSLFRYLVKPQDPINQAYIKDACRQSVLNQPFIPEHGHDLYRHRKEGPGDQLPEAFMEHLGELKKMPLYELTERLISIFNIQSMQDEIPYIQAFQEVVLGFSKRYASDLNSFLEWWELNASKQKLQLPEDYEAIRITTIHKAKGLEFKVVLVPFCNWELNASGSGLNKNFLWCAPRQDTLSEVGVVPVQYSSSLSDTLFYREYYAEKFHQYVDSLNLLYVAFTRAEEALISYVPLKVRKDGTPNHLASDKGITHVGELIHFIYEQQDRLSSPEGVEAPFISQMKDYWDPDEMVFWWGNLNERTEEYKVQQDQLFQDTYPVFSSKPPLHLRYEHSEFFSESTDLFQGTVDHGRMMHQVFEDIHTFDDIGG
ncbi:MAG TPA: UvrD-helicase domain-containing protein, partial [Bacteroidales bacterium]|nr:UvrD-helicase domain-containing protein [Bacteroidales bacterium]